MQVVSGLSPMSLFRIIPATQAWLKPTLEVGLSSELGTSFFSAGPSTLARRRGRKVSCAGGGEEGERPNFKSTPPGTRTNGGAESHHEHSPGPSRQSCHASFPFTGSVLGLGRRGDTLPISASQGTACAAQRRGNPHFHLPVLASGSEWTTPPELQPNQPFHFPVLYLFIGPGSTPRLYSRLRSSGPLPPTQTHKTQFLRGQRPQRRGFRPWRPPSLLAGPGLPEPTSSRRGK